MFVLYQLTGLIGIDCIAALPLTIIAITVLERMTLSFALSVLMAAFINEKIVLVAFLLVALRLIFTKEDRRFYYVATGSAALSLFAIVAAVYVLHFPGNENHMDPSTYLTSTWRMLMSTFTLKGAYLTLWPVLLLVGLWVAGMTVPRRRRLVAVSDVGVIVGMVLIAFALGVDYNVGRIVIYSAALFVIVATQALAPLRHEEERAEETTSET